MNRPVTIITGSSRGIGLHLAKHYLQLGHKVVGCSRGACDLSAEDYEHYALDILSQEAVMQMVSQVKDRYGRVDHLINNAGIAAMNHFLLTPMTTVENVLATNVQATFLFCREVGKVMQRHRYGRIVNFSTVAVPLRLGGEAIYAASKAAVVSLTQIFAQELGSFGITVNAVGPTPVKTDLIKNVPSEKINQLIDRQAIKRFGEFSDVSNIIDFFLRKESAFVTGQTLYLGGIS